MSQYVKLTTSNGILNVNNKPIALTANVNTHDVNINNEITRARNAELSLTNNIITENNRAINVETVLSNNISTETSRAKSSELSLANNISTETSRAKRTEGILTTAINVTEYNRAINSETSLYIAISNETSRAKFTETTLTTAINVTEYNRATNAEQSIVNRIQNIVSGAPSILDTIGEIAIALSNNPSVIISIQSSIAIQTSKAISTETILSNSISTQVSLLSDLSFNGLIDITKSVATDNEFKINVDISTANSRSLTTKASISTVVSNYNTNTIVPLTTSISREISRAILSETAISSSLSIVNYNTKNIANTTLTTVAPLESNIALNFNKQPKLSYIPRSIDTVSNFETNSTDFGVLNYLGGTLQKSYWLKREGDKESANKVTGNDGGTGPSFNYIVVPPGLYFLAVEVLLQNTGGQTVYEQSLTLNEFDDIDEYKPSFSINNFRRSLSGFHYRTLRNTRGDQLWSDAGFVNSIVNLSGVIGPFNIPVKLYLKQFINVQWDPTITPYFMKVSYQLTRLG